MSRRIPVPVLMAVLGLACSTGAPLRATETAVLTPAPGTLAASAAPVSAAGTSDAPTQTSLPGSGGPDPAGSPLPAAAVQKSDTCGLRATLRELPPKDGFARYTLTLTNDGKKPVSLVIPGDGSEAGWRTPTLTWIATTSGKPGVAKEGGRCGMMNAIAESEIFTLAPGASREITEWLGLPSFVAGAYDLRLRYRNDPALQAKKASVTPEVAQKIAQSQSCDVTSNAIKTTLQP